MQVRNPVWSWLLLRAMASVLVALVVPLGIGHTSAGHIENSHSMYEAHRFPPVGLVHCGRYGHSFVLHGRLLHDEHCSPRPPLS